MRRDNLKTPIDIDKDIGTKKRVYAMTFMFHSAEHIFTSAEQIFHAVEQRIV